MGTGSVRCWLVGLLVVVASASEVAKKSKDHFCILNEQAIAQKPPAVCHPLEPCDGATLAQHYEGVRKQCLAAAAKRRDAMSGFLFQMNYWHGDFTFFFNLMKKTHEEKYRTALAVERASKETGSEVRDELVRKHFIYSVETGRLADALYIYTTIPNQPTATEVMAVIGDNPNGVNEAVLRNVLYFVKVIPDKPRRVEFYRALKPVLYKHKIEKTYLAVLYGIEAHPSIHRTGDYQEYYHDVVNPVVAKWKGQMFSAQYNEILWVEQHFPLYFAFLIPALTVFTRDEWTKKLDQYELYEQVNNLQRLANRVTMYERIVDNTLVFGVGKNTKTDMEAQQMLRGFANQVDKLQRALEKAGRDPKLMKRLEAVQGSFAKLHKRRGREHWNYKLYLENFKKYGRITSMSAARSRWSG